MKNILPTVLLVVAVAVAGLEFFWIKQLQGQIQTANARLEKASSEIQQANAAFAQIKQMESLKLLPIRVTKRQALLGSGMVLAFQNEGMESLPLNITISNPTFGSKSWQVVIDANKAQEIGHLEGWSVSPQDLVEIGSSGYRPMKVTVN